MLLAHVMRRIVRSGTLEVIDHRGRAWQFGEAGRTPDVVMRLHTARADRRLLLKPELALGEAFMDGELTVEKGGIYGLLELLTRNVGPHGKLPFTLPTWLTTPIVRLFTQYNPLGLAEQRVRHHYDLSGALYEKFLDADRQYSCAYFPAPGTGLEEAQLLKKRHIAAKLLLQPGQRVLDIGSGWGGMGLYLAQVADVEVIGCTLSHEQHALANRRAEELGLASRVKFVLQDYRTLDGRFDRIVSVGMFEHVGVPHYQVFFDKVAALLADDGVALLHSIGRIEGPGTTNAWLRKYIFPGGYSPALSELSPPIERAGFWLTDLEVLRLHYAETLRLWRERFLAERDAIRALYDERFCRMWEFYLCGCEVAFRHWGQIVFQAQLAKRIDTVPLTRDYIAAAEARLAHLEQRLGPLESPAQKPERRRLHDVNA